MAVKTTSILTIVLAALAALALPTVAASRSDATPAAISGKWTRTVTQADVRRRGLAATGPWRLELTTSGTMRLFNGSSRKAIGTGRVTAAAGTLKMVNLNVVGGGRCAKEEEATYRYSMNSGRLVLSATRRDKCPGRATVLVGTWRRA
jgi:hypothetical protein